MNLSGLFVFESVFRLQMFTGVLFFVGAIYPPFEGISCFSTSSVMHKPLGPNAANTEQHMEMYSALLLH